MPRFGGAFSFVTDCEQAIPTRHYALSAVYSSHINRTGPMTTFTATTDQQFKAEMAIRFKAIKMGATANQVNLWSVGEVLTFISNHA